MLRVKASSVVTGHLSDIELEIGSCAVVDREQVRLRIKFVKYVMAKLRWNLDQWIDPDEMFEQFNKKQNTKADAV